MNQPDKRMKPENNQELMQRDLAVLWHPCTQMKDHESYPLIPIKNGSLLLGTWQGIYLCEHRNNGGSRQIVITVNGDE